jgi:hypothetical protein
MKRKMTDFAFALKCGFLGANGFESFAGVESAAANAERAREPKPPPATRRKSRRDENRGTCGGFQLTAEPPHQMNAFVEVPSRRVFGGRLQNSTASYTLCGPEEDFWIVLSSA